MLKSEINILTDLAAALTKPAEGKNLQTEQTEQVFNLTAWQAACQRLKEKWVQEYFSTVRDHVLRRYIQFHQAGLVALSDEIYETYIKSARNNMLARAALEAVEELLNFLEMQCYPYFDQEYLVTAFACENQQLLWKKDMETYGQAMHAISIDAELIDAIENSLTTALSHFSSTGVTFSQRKYLNQVLKALNLSVSANGNTEHLSRMLLEWNFNSTYFEQWYERQLKKHFSNELTKAVVITEQLRLLNSLIRQEASFDNRVPPISERIRQWLMQQFAEANQSQADPVIPDATAQRLPLNLSVPQLAFFARLCYLEGCFHSGNITRMLRFFANHFETKKQLRISLKSFSKAFYATDQATAAVIRDYLQRMVNLIDKTYFPKT